MLTKFIKKQFVLRKYRDFDLVRQSFVEDSKTIYKVPVPYTGNFVMKKRLLRNLRS